MLASPSPKMKCIHEFVRVRVYMVYVCMQCSCRRMPLAPNLREEVNPLSCSSARKYSGCVCASMCASMCECMRERMRALACVMVTAQHAYTSEHTCYLLPLTLTVVSSLHLPLPLAPAVAPLPLAHPPSLLTLSPPLSLSVTPSLSISVSLSPTHALSC